MKTKKRDRAKRNTINILPSLFAEQSNSLKMKSKSDLSVHFHPGELESVNIVTLVLRKLNPGNRNKVSIRIANK
jgi:urease beta subunit